MNILFIAIDTLRADYLGCYGYSKPTSPNIDALAASGVCFENDFAVASYTHPNYTSMYTGRYPITHGVVLQGGHYYMPDEIPVLPEMLRSAGYTTAVVSNLPRSGKAVETSWFGRGADRHVPYDTKPPASEGIRNNSMAHVKDLAMPLLDELKGQKFFMFVHCWDPHRPYLPQPPYDEMYVPEGAPNRTNFSVDPVPETEPQGLAYTIAQYEGAITDCDAALGELLARLDELGLHEDTLVLLTADHGESLGEHRIYFRHAAIYEPTVHVPLIMSCPGHLPAGRRVEAFAQPVDLAPTILSLLGISDEWNMEGHDLTAVAQGDAEETYDRVMMHSINPDMRRAIRTRTHKFIQLVPGCEGQEAFPAEELYDLRNDPAETANVIGEQTGVAADLRNQLESWVREKVEARGGEDPMVEQSRPGGRWPIW